MQKVDSHQENNSNPDAASDLNKHDTLQMPRLTVSQGRKKNGKNKTHDSPYSHELKN
jgi:hypothetical protein